MCLTLTAGYCFQLSLCRIDFEPLRQATELTCTRLLEFEYCKLIWILSIFALTSDATCRRQAVSMSGNSLLFQSARRADIESVKTNFLNCVGVLESFFFNMEQ